MMKPIRPNHADGIVLDWLVAKELNVPVRISLACPDEGIRAAFYTKVPGDQGTVEVEW